MSATWHGKLGCRGDALARDGRDGQVTLTDGRTLAYAEYGYARGAPAFYFHGTPGGRLEGRFLDAAARAHGVRLIALDRPGYGRSVF